MHPASPCLHMKAGRDHTVAPNCTAASIKSHERGDIGGLSRARDRLPDWGGRPPEPGHRGVIWGLGAFGGLFNGMEMEDTEV